MLCKKSTCGQGNTKINKLLNINSYMLIISIPAFFHTNSSTRCLIGCRVNCIGIVFLDFARVVPQQPGLLHGFLGHVAQISLLDADFSQAALYAGSLSEAV